ncbi:MAG: META domain-containing protein [Ignavibacteriae bacterium]|nr:META domain-containing protein [Ignavibacteriota bacterium]
MKRILFLLALAIVLGISVQSCREMGIDPWGKGGNGGGDTKDSTVITLPIEKLVGTKWQLVSIIGNSQNKLQTVPKGQFISLAFETPFHVSGTNICNNYGANVHSTQTGSVSFNEIVSTEAYCGDGLLDGEYIIGLQGATSYTASEKELRINYLPNPLTAEGSSKTLVFAPLTNTGGGNGGGNDNPQADMRVKQLSGRNYTLYSFVNANLEDVLIDSKNCTIFFKPYSTTGRNGTASILADCNKGNADLSFNDDATSMKLDNISLTKMACQNQITANRFVEFLRNTGSFEVSDNGATVTIWSSLQTFAESKMVLKVVPVIEDPLPLNIIQIQQTPPAGVPVSTYPSLYLSDWKFDGQYINIYYQYGGSINDYRISAYSLFEFTNNNASSMIVDLVTDGTSNPINTLTNGQASISLDAIRKRIMTANPNKTKITVMFRYNGQQVAEVDIVV